MAIAYTYRQLVERIRRHIANEFPDSSFSVSENETQLYIEQALAATIVGQVYAGAKVEGNLVMPEAYLTTYLLPALTQDSVTREWTTTLPQPPLSLPLGYSIDNGYFANSVNGRGKQVAFVKAKSVSYRDDMPYPNRVMAWVEGVTVKLKVPDGSSLLNENFYVRMASSRISGLTDTMTIPGDAIEPIFNNVVQKIINRLQLPKDIIQDDIGAGNKSS
jgi:hypothetical protein